MTDFVILIFSFRQLFRDWTFFLLSFILFEMVYFSVTKTTCDLDLSVQLSHSPLV